MPTDPFQSLRAITEHAELFTDGRAQAEAAVASIFAAAVKAADKARLATICGAIGAEDFDALAGGLKPSDLRAIVDRIEGATRPARTPAVALASLQRIGRGIVPSPVPDLAVLDLVGLRKTCETLADGFEAWLAAQGAKAKPALQRLDPHFSKVATVTPARARPRLIDLARGVPPTPAEPGFRLADLDVDGIRRARAELGDRFMPWIEAQKSADLKAALVRIDKLRPNVKKLPRTHYPFLLGEIASGVSPFTKDEDSPPIGEETFSMRNG